MKPYSFAALPPASALAAVLLAEGQKEQKLTLSNVFCVLKRTIYTFSDISMEETMAYKIIDIEGIGEAYAPKLIAAGIKTPEELLEACGKPAGRKKLAEQTGISEKLILKWTNHADLFRIHGVGPQYAELLEASGVDTVKELKHRVPANLTKKMVEVNQARNLAQRDPTEKEVTKWVEEADKLEAKVSY